MNTLYLVANMAPSPKGRFVRIQLEDGENVHLVQISLEEVHLCDVRIGDTVASNPQTQSLCACLDQRPPEAVPYQA